MMDGRRIVVTGIGVVSSIGIGKEPFWDSLFAGKSGIKPITLFDASKTHSRLAGEISDFDPVAILGPRGLRTLDRTTLLALSAAKLCLDDAGLEAAPAIAGEIGVVLGSTMGSVKSTSDFDLESLREGPRYVDPALFPNVLMNSPASRISVRFGAGRLNATVSTGYSASLDAIGYASDLIGLGRAEALLAGGVEELCLQTFLGFHKIGILSESGESRPELSCPFDRRRNGVVLGEGAALFLLESLDHARTREAPSYVEILGYGTSFDPARRDGYNPKGEGAARAIRLALSEARIDPGEVDAVSASANSTLECDAMETRALKDVFAEKAYRMPVSALKSMAGEPLSAHGALSVAAGIGSIRRNRFFQTVNYQEKDPRCDLDYGPYGTEGEVDRILVNCFGPSGENASLVLSRPG